MTPDEYRELRERLGSQARVARMLDAATSTIARRELGESPIDREAEYALRWLVECKSTEVVQE